MHRLHLAGPLLMLLILLNGCSLIGAGGGVGRTAEQILREALSQVDVDLVDLSPDIRIKRGTGLLPIPEIDLAFDIELALTNNSAIPLLAKAVDLNLFTARDEFSRTPAAEDALAVAAFTKDVSLPRGDRKLVPLRLEANAEQVGREIVNLIQGGDLFYRLDAAFSLHYKGVTLPLNVTLDEGDSGTVGDMLPGS